MKLTRILLFVAVTAALAINTDGLQAQDFYFDRETMIPVTISDEKITVQIEGSMAAFDIGSFLGNHPCLSAGEETPPEEIGRNCITFYLAPSCSWATAAPDLRLDPAVVRVLPVYLTPETSEFTVTDLVSVQFNENLTTDSCLTIAASYGLRFEDSSQFRHNYWWLALEDTVGDSPLASGNDLHVRADVEWSSATMYSSAGFDSEPTDPYFVNQYYLKNTGQTGGTPGADIDAAGAWEITLGGGRIAVLDDGFVAHPDLPNLNPVWDVAGDNVPVSGWTWSNSDPEPTPGMTKNHGMACSGIIGAAHNGAGVAGISPGSEVLGIKVADTSGFIPRGNRALVNGLYLAYALGARVISNSWSYYQLSPIPEIAEAIRYISDPCSRPGGGGQPGVICVFSSGNRADKQILHQELVAFPANMTETIAVGAVDKNSIRWPYSQYGSALDVVTPSGLDIQEFTTTFRGDVWTLDQQSTLGWNPLITGAAPGETPDIDYTAKMGGTSASCAMVAGVVALLLERRPDLRNGCAPYETVREILAGSAVDLGDPGKDPLYGAGRVSAHRALLSVIHGDVDKNGFVDATDLSILIDACFFGQPMPYEYSLGDMDCNGFVDATDLAFEIDLVFFGWGPPAPCFVYY